ncbi:unnamed protein product [Microthlaspi erraticum]|uniref:Histone chaperone domain-containing protein n=1 Tax=Microthlaspi erraticum TaxID=1685480 RepID=A0A6D2JEY8_9BRAS|nr:unnamed protein product [Microthlaspi erraticum]
MDDKEVAVEKTETRRSKNENGEPVSGKKKGKHIETDSESDSDAGDDSEMMKANGHSQKPLKMKEAATSVNGKRVEHLKSVIKYCGIKLCVLIKLLVDLRKNLYVWFIIIVVFGSVPPAIYRKVKKAPEEKREDTLIEELEQILAKEGLSSDPSEKEIKEVKKNKDISKELEGIDTSNIVSSTSFIPPMPKITSESESDEEEESENGEDNEEEEEEGNEEAEEGSQNEEESNNGVK